ncbi:MAG: DmsE family decaheme c-type cytochrome [candidate division Zixibacteria bacterium]|nr:DmsE family decaheme c-type cytochrome [candidate division Zixibacteria bacterium]
MKQTTKAGPRWLATALIAVALLLMGQGLLAGVPDETCADCHDEVAEGFAETMHAKFLADRADLEGHLCESCHGDGTAHVNDEDPALIINPAKADQFGSSQLCMTCHTDDQFDGWMFSEHAGADVNCASCHTVHTSDATPAAAQCNETCYSCHSDVRAAGYMPSHHPIAEGKMTCRDCHNPHGGSVTMAMGDSKRDLCLSCHAEIEGPHVYEHAPVTEDCGICHDAHGSVADKLLKQTEPALCLNCHAMHFHATVVSYDGDFEVPMAPERAGTSNPDSWKSGMLTKCTQCHTAIHGSDLSSQTTTTGGNALTR